MPKATDSIIDQLSRSIADDVGNTTEDDIDSISSAFDKTLSDALKVFNSSTFDDDGFIKKMQDLDTGDQKDKDMMKNVLNNVRTDYVNIESINQSEILLRRDIFNICSQMPEMHDVINVIRDSIIECNVSTGEVSRSLIFENHEDNEAFESQAKEVENRHDLLMAIKNFIVPRTLMNGENYILRVPFAKLFAELEAIHDNRGLNKKTSYGSPEANFHESIPVQVLDSFKSPVNLYNEANLNVLMESVAPMTKVDSTDEYKIDSDPDKSSKTSMDFVGKEGMSSLLKNIEVYNGSSVMMAEMGEYGFKEVLMREYKESRQKARTSSPETHFMEMQTNNFGKVDNGLFADVDQDTIDFTSYKDIKGCYIKYLDSLRMVPIRLDRRIVGYYYVSTTMDLQSNPGNPNGIIDLSYQHYTRDRNLVDNLADMIIRSFDKKMLEKNIKLKNEIAEIVMAHKFADGKLSFIYIPENEVERIIINEDEEGKGHSVLEPSLFPARNYLMLNMYNMLYTLNNGTTRVHYLKSSGLNKDYASQIQRTMRKFQQRRITIDDIYSYSGVLNKVGGMGEMVLPAGRNDYKALETDTIEAARNPIDTEFLEQQRRQAISGTGVPHLLMINAIDEPDFAKTLEMANTRFTSTVSSYKIDINRGLTKLYRFLMKWETDLEDDVVQSFKFMFNAIKQPEMVITADMIQNFNSIVDLVMEIYYSKTDMQDKDGNPTPKQMHLRKELAKEYLPQLDFDRLDEVVKRVDILAMDDATQQRVNDLSISDKDLSEVEES